MTIYLTYRKDQIMPRNNIKHAFKLAEIATSAKVVPVQALAPSAPTSNNVAVIAAKPKAPKAAKEAQFAAVSVAAFGYASSHKAVIDAIAAAGGAQAEVQRRFHIGYIAYRLNVGASALDADMLHVAAVALGSMNRKGERAGLKLSEKAANEPGVARKGKRVRSFNEQKAYDASRTAWSAILKLADIKTTSTRGGARKPRPGANKEAPKETLPDLAKASPGFDTLPALHGFMLMQAMMLLRTCNKNAKIATPQITSAVSDFVAAIKACSPAD